MHATTMRQKHSQRNSGRNRPTQSDPGIEGLGRQCSPAQLTLPVLLDSEATVADLYRVSGIPQTVLIGPRGAAIWPRPNRADQVACFVSGVIVRAALPKQRLPACSVSTLVSQDHHVVGDDLPPQVAQAARAGPGP